MTDSRSRSQRWSDVVAEWCGSWGFVLSFTALVAAWILLNTRLLLFGKFDEFPFIFLNLFLTIVSTFQSPVIMMSQNRQVERDREAVRGLHEKLDRALARLEDGKA